MIYENAGGFDDDFITFGMAKVIIDVSDVV